MSSITSFMILLEIFEAITMEHMVAISYYFVFAWVSHREVFQTEGATFFHCFVLNLHVLGLDISKILNLELAILAFNN